MTIYASDECSQLLKLDSHRVLRGAVFNFEVGVDGQNGFGLCVAQVAKDRRVLSNPARHSSAIEQGGVPTYSLSISALSSAHRPL